MVSDLVIRGKVPNDLAGPVGIARITGEVAKKGWIPLFQLARILSINLAVVNILPIPALDNGRLLFLGIEKLRESRWIRTRALGPPDRIYTTDLYF